MSFLTAALYGLGAFGQGRQQRQNYQLEQQRQADTHAYEQAQTQAEQARIAQEQATGNRAQIAQVAALRAKGLSPTGDLLPQIPIHLPPNLQRVVPGKVGPNYKVTSQDETNHKIALLRFQATQYRNQGRTDYADSLDATADGLEKQLISENAETARELLAQYSQGQQNYRTGEEIAAGITRTGMNNATSLQNNQNTVGGAMDRTVIGQTGATGRTQMTIDAANSRNAASIAQRYSAQSNNDLRQQQTQNDEATRHSQPLPHPELDGYKKNLTSAISAVAQNPKLLPIILKQFESHVSDPTLLMYARRQLQDAARDAQAASKNIQPGMEVPQDNAPAGLGQPRQAPPPQF